MIEVNYKKKGGVYTFSCTGVAEDPYGACASILVIALDSRLRMLVTDGAVEIRRHAVSERGAYFTEFSATGYNGDQEDKIAQAVVDTIMHGFTYMTAHYPEYVKVNAEVEPV
jgi:uncharacterized protein YsxB (DUF464 family)